MSNQWVHTDQGLPPLGEIVLCYLFKQYPDKVRLGYWNGKRWVSPTNQKSLRYVSHWLPIPEMPLSTDALKVLLSNPD